MFLHTERHIRRTSYPSVPCEVCRTDVTSGEIEKIKVQKTKDVGNAASRQMGI